MYGVKCSTNYGFDNELFQIEVPPRIRQAFRGFCEPLLIHDEIIHSSQNFLQKYEGSSVLLLGGGGSTSRFLNSSPDLSNYDFIWSLNNFYKNEYIHNNVNVDLFTVGPEVSMQDQKLLDYLNNHKTIAAFELHQKWGRNFVNSETGQTPQEIWEETDKFYDNERKCVFQTKFYSQLGGGVRLIIYAAQLGVKNINFIGFDGPTAIIKGDHAFEVGKKSFPGAVRHIRDLDKIKFFKTQYDVFWRYIKNISDINIVSIDKTNVLHEKLNG